MRERVRKKIGTGVIDRLVLVADFLTSGKWKSKEVPELQAIGDNLRLIISPPDPLKELSWVDRPGKDWVDRPGKKVKKLRKYGLSRAAMFSTRNSALERLLEKLSRMNLEARYTTKYFSPGPKWESQGMEGNPTAASQYFGIEKGMMKFPDGQEITVKKFLNARSPEEELCGIILEAIDTLELVRLRQCGECGKFFVARHLGQDYCPPRCRKLHDKKAAIERSRRWRKSKKTKGTKRRIERGKRKGAESLDIFFKKYSGSYKERMKVKRFIERNLPGGSATVELLTTMRERNDPREKIWDTLGGEVKRALRQYFKDS